MSTGTGSRRAGRLVALCAGLLALTACSLGGGESLASAKQTQRAATAVAEEAVPVAARALGARRVEAHAEWSSCMGLSWRYKAGVAVHAPDGHARARLRAVKAALLDDGFTASLMTDSQVSLERSGIAVTIYRPSPAAEDVWPVIVESGCAGYSDEARALIDDDRGTDLPGLQLPGLQP